MSRTASSLHAIVPAGGAGTRLWPLSRVTHPKFLLDLTGSGRSLLQQTWDRLVPLVGADRINVITGAAHRDAVAAQLPRLGAANLVAEPSPRDSMAAIGLLTALIHRRDPGAVVASFAADHLIADQDEFEAVVHQAAAAAHAGYVATIGIEPTEPSTAFGYIEAARPIEGLAGAPDARLVSRFVEKPDLETAQRYLESDAFRWNAGMFLARTDVLLTHLAQQQPRLAEGIDEIAEAWETPAAPEVLDRVWPNLTKIAIDHAIAEPVGSQGGIAMVPAAFGWTDVGDFASVAQVLESTQHNRGGVTVLGDPDLVTSISARGLAVTSNRTISLVGVEDVIVVDTPDALLVTTKAHAQQVKQAVDRWRAAGRDDLL